MENVNQPPQTETQVNFAVRTGRYALRFVVGGAVFVGLGEGLSYLAEGKHITAAAAAICAVTGGTLATINSLPHASDSVEVRRRYRENDF